MQSEQLNRTVAPAIYQLQTEQLPAVTRRQLANGVELVILNQGEQPVNRINVVWPIGEVDVDVHSVLSVLCQMVTEGTDQHSGAAITEMLEYYGAWARMDSSQHSTVVTLHSLNHTADKVIPLLAEIVEHSNFPEEAFLRLRDKLAAQIELNWRKVSTRSLVLSRKMLYGESHRLARVSTGEGMRAVTREDVVELHRRLILGARPTIYLAGYVTEELVRLVSDSFGTINFGAEPNGLQRLVTKFAAPSKSETSFDEVPGSMQTAINIMFPTLERHNPDYEALRFTVFALGGYFGSRLMSNIREEKGYTYGITAALSSLPEGSRIRINCEAGNEYVADVLREIDNEVARLANEEMSDEELAVVKQTVMSSLTALLDSPFTVMDYHRQIDEQNLGEDYYTYQLAELQRFNAARAKEMAQKYLLNCAHVTALAGVKQN
jgi:predicted Zn-dependent peptidase